MVDFKQWSGFPHLNALNSRESILEQEPVAILKYTIHKILKKLIY